MTKWLTRRNKEDKPWKYYVELDGDSSTTISWNLKKTAWWLFIADQPIAGTFPDKESVKAEYEVLKK